MQHSQVINWIHNGDLQVTSRERNPQFCGSPPRFRDRGFYSIKPEELSCTKKDNASTTTTIKIDTQETQNVPKVEPVGVATVVSADLEDLVAANPDILPSSSTTTKKPTVMTTALATSTSVSVTTSKITSSTAKSTTTAKFKAKTVSPWTKNQRPPMILGYPSRSSADESREVIVKNAFRQDNSVIIQWGSETANILGFRVVYRLFGDKSFKQGPPLEASEREFKIKNVPSQVTILALSF